MVALFAEDDSHAVLCLAYKEISKLGISLISHGITRELKLNMFSSEDEESEAEFDLENEVTESDSMGEIRSKVLISLTEDLTQRARRIT
ncbi:MAG: hypothetical protein R3A13_01080 [Bdellovibrionota bacterium]